VELIAALGRTMGLSFAAGINLYATVVVLGLASRLGWVDLPDRFQAIDSNIVIAGALLLYMVEFVADKIPWVDSAWDTVHTFIRPVGGALIAVVTIGDASPTVEGLVALLGGSVAASTHFTKTGARVAVNTSPEPISNWILSFAEDAFVVGLGSLAIAYPVAALAVVVGLLAVILTFFGALIGVAWRRFSGRFRPYPSGTVGKAAP
jgi:hypothetical protein